MTGPSPNPLSDDLTHYEMPGGWSTPIFTTDKGTIYTSLWKLFLSVYPSYYFVGSRSRAYPGRGHVYIQSCVTSPYTILLGNVSFSENNGHYSISCINCTLTNCMDSSMFPTSTILIVHQPPYVLLPVNISGDWYDEKALQIFHEVRKLLLRPKRFISILIASIIAIVSVVATAATAAVSLAHSVQTASYVNHLAKNISVTMETQKDIEKKIEVKLNALQETVNIIGDKVYNIQNHLTLHCHVDFKYICVTNTPYNDTHWKWPLVKAHLQGIWSHNNMSLDILKLQQEIHVIDFSRRELPEDARDIINTLSSWTQGFHLPSFSSIIAVSGCVLLLIVCLPFIFRLVFSSLQKMQLKLFELHLKSKNGGNAGIAPAKGP
uniref:Retroviral envelope protein GP41-like domain-containing protein n=1 Tax=Callithrix jacchus TaxID=9483 RepID=A0A5F4WES7_CALJA